MKNLISLELWWTKIDAHRRPPASPSESRILSVQFPIIPCEFPRECHQMARGIAEIWKGKGVLRIIQLFLELQIHMITCTAIEIRTQIKNQVLPGSNVANAYCLSRIKKRRDFGWVPHRDESWLISVCSTIGNQHTKYWINTRKEYTPSILCWHSKYRLSLCADIPCIYACKNRSVLKLSITNTGDDFLDEGI